MSQLSVHNAWPTSKQANLQASRTREDEDVPNAAKVTEVWAVKLVQSSNK